MDFVQLDVFAGRAFEGNPLAVFADAGELTTRQMQAIASEMNLSETTFVTAHDSESYRVRIFTPDEELEFAGHPTIGTTWVLRHLGLVDREEIVQHSRVGATRVLVRGERIFFDREGSAEPDLDRREVDIAARLERGLSLRPGDVGLEARELGRSGHLRAAFSDAGLRHMMIPLASVDALGRCMPIAAELPPAAPGGYYCFTATQAGRVQARGFFPGLGVSEDPATGSAAADLGVYLADRLGDIDLEIAQGIEMGRPSRMFVRARAGRVEVGGSCHLVFRGELENLP